MKKKNKSNVIIHEYDKSTLLINKPDYLKYLISTEVILTINRWNIDHFKLLGYKNLTINNKWKVPVEHLMLNGSSKVECKCKFCDHIQETIFQKFMINYKRGDFYSCKSCSNVAYKISMLFKYGVENACYVKKFQDKKKITCLNKYGNIYEIASDDVKKKIKKVLFEKYGGHHIMNENIRNTIISKGIITKIQRGLIVLDEKLSEWLLYRRNVRRLTERNRKILLEKWDGLDFYDGEYIKDNFNLKSIDKKYPTLDHKISIYYGYTNNISFEIISDISNLCITKRYINCIKSIMTTEQYLNKKEN